MSKTLLIYLLFTISLGGCATHPTRVNTNTARPNSANTSESSELKQLVIAVRRVKNGDTIEFVDNNGNVDVVQLQGIDAPEGTQEFGDESAANLTQLISGKTVTVEFRKRDGFKRIVGKILWDGQDICLAQIKAGLAWHYKRFEHEQSEEDRTLYSEAELQARSQRIGLWIAPNPIPPWDYRSSRRSIF